MRSEMTHFLHDISQRQKSLAQWEARSLAVQRHIRKKLAHVATVLQDAKQLDARLENRRHQLAQLNTTIDDARHEMSALELEIHRLKQLRQEENTTHANLKNEKEKLDHLAQRLQQFQTTIQQRRSELDHREQHIERRESTVAHLDHVDRLVPHLQALLDDAGETIRLRDDVPAAARRLHAIFRDVRNGGRQLREKRSELLQLQADVTRREKDLRSREGDLHSKELELSNARLRLDTEKDEIADMHASARAAWSGVEEAVRDGEGREAAMRKREDTVLQAEHTLRKKEHNIRDAEKAIAKRESSIRRAVAAVEAREKLVENRLKEVDVERSAVDGMRKAVEIRENTVETRDLELSVREGGRLDALLQHSLDPLHRPAVIQQTNSHTAPTDTLLPGANRSDQPPRTVRRQLAFESTRKPDGSTTVLGGPPDAPGKGADVPDDESEAAAEELLPELVGARSLWTERVVRLEAVVQNMRDSTWSLKPHIQPLLASIAEKLNSIRLEICVTPERSGSAAKHDYSRERQCQMQWGAILKQQLDAVREVQTGMLIGMNRDEDMAGEDAINADASDKEDSTGSVPGIEDEDNGGEIAEDRESNPSREDDDILTRAGGAEEEGSVEATLDATVTATGDFTGNRLGTSGGEGDLTVSFRRFRAQMRDVAASSTASPTLYRQAEDRDPGDDREAVERNQDLFSELDALRNELKTVVPSQSPRGVG